MKDFYHRWKNTIETVGIPVLMFTSLGLILSSVLALEIIGWTLLGGFFVWMLYNSIKLSVSIDKRKQQRDAKENN